MWFVYLLECEDGSYYTGITTNLERRMKEHKGGEGSRYVASRGFSCLLAHARCRDRSQASKLEHRIKQIPRHRKLQFLRSLQGQALSCGEQNERET